MQPRDSFLVIDDIVLATNLESIDIIKTSLKDLTANFVIPWDSDDQFFLDQKFTFDAPLVTVIGDTIIIDCQSHDWLYEYFCKAFPTYKIKPVCIGGHNDAVYSVIKPGVLISTFHHTNYSETFPGWTVKFIENQSWNAIPDWRKIKHSNIDRWWAPDNILNNEFSTFIDTWLGNWVGYVKESVFDVNLLQINDGVVLVNNYNKDLFDFFKQHKVEPIIVPFRHRFFWDGGLHCITNDLYRDGCKQSYFE
jgi:sporulation protein YlmC with PRC-barrel domain